MAGKTGINEEITNQIKGILLIALGVFCYIGLHFTEQAGTIGLFVNNTLRVFAGETAMVIPFGIIIFALRTMVPEKTLNLKSRLIGVALILLLFTVTFHFNFMLENIEALDSDESFLSASFSMGYQHEGGGLLGAFFSVILYYLFGEVASYVVIITVALVGIMLIMNVSVTQILSQLKNAGRLLFNLIKAAGRFIRELYRTHQTEELKKDTSRQSNHTELYSIQNHENDSMTSNINNSVHSQTQENNIGDYANPENIQHQEKALGEAAEEKTKDSKISQSEDYIFPPVDLMNKPSRTSDPNQNKHIKERARLLENTLHSFGVQAKVINYESGPTVTRFEVQPEIGVKVSKILNLADDLALNLAAPVVRIEAPIPGKAALGVEVPNKVTSLVYFREVLESPEFQEYTSPLTIVLGKDITGVPVITSLDQMPHLLIAGATGSGKSVCLNVIICSILYKAHPDELKFLIIDPKMVELNVYNGIPHLLTPVVTDPKKASAALKNMIKEMTKRYDLFAHNGVKDISAYNERVQKGELEGEKLPYIVVVIDELADLMLISPGEVEDAISRLSQMARAAGIHLIIATQRPSVDVLTGVIKANITSRIAFTVSSQVDSRTILDMAGAEKLLGRGDMLFHPVGNVKPVRVQSSFISTKEINSLTNFLRQQVKESEDNQEDITENVEDNSFEEVDPLLPDAIELVVRTGHASISLLQRRFRIGYSRAARLIDELEIKGVVGEHEGSKPREILVSSEEANRLYEDFKQKLS